MRGVPAANRFEPSSRTMPSTDLPSLGVSECISQSFDMLVSSRHVSFIEWFVSHVKTSLLETARTSLRA